MRFLHSYFFCDIKSNGIVAKGMQNKDANFADIAVGCCSTPL